MPTDNHEDWPPWQIARTVAADIHRLTRTPAFRRDPDMKRRLRTMTREIMTSVATGYSRAATWCDLVESTRRAGKLAAELASLVYVAGDTGLIVKKRSAVALDRIFEMERLLRACEDHARRRMLAALVGSRWIN